jgi:PAS domain S-box-containing protein
VSELPLRARILIAASVAGGAMAAAWQIPDVTSWTFGDAAAWAALSAGAVLTERFVATLRHGTEGENFTLTDIAWTGALILARPSVLVLAAVTGVVAGQLAQRWRLIKVAFNAGQFALATTSAVAVYGVFPPASPLDPMAWIAVAAGMGAFFVVNEGMVASVIALVGGGSIRSILATPRLANLLHWAGNVTLGILGAVVWWAQPAALGLLIGPAILAFLAYRGLLRSLTERERAREQERMDTFHAAGRQLLELVDADPDFRPFLRTVSRMVDATCVELVTVGHGIICVQDSRGRRAEVAAGGPDPHLVDPRRYLSAIAQYSPHVVPIGAEDLPVAVMAVHRAADLQQASRSLLEAVASQLEVKLDNIRVLSTAREQRAQLEEIILNTHDGIVLLSRDGGILTWNPAMERITGLPAREVTGRPWTQVMRFEDAVDLRPQEREDPERSRHDVLAAFARPNGAQRWMRYARNPIMDQQQVVKASVVVARDATREIETERLRAELLGAVSHELRTPLTPLKGFLYSLSQGTIEDSPEARQDCYRRMLNQADRLERLLNDLLEATRLDAGRPELDTRVADLSRLVTREVDHYRPLHPNRDIEVLTPELVRALCDPFRVAQVLSNLLTNAFKYAPPPTPIRVTVRPEGLEAVVSVRDEGPGIPLVDHGRVFERFQQVGGGVLRRAGGVGLGLYIAKQLVEAMNGRLWLDSEPGAGSTFSFSLPLASRDGPISDASSLAATVS